MKKRYFPAGGAIILLLSFFAGALEKPHFSLLGVVVVPDSFSSVAIIKENRTGTVKCLKTGEKILGFCVVGITEKAVSIREGREVREYLLTAKSPELRRKIEPVEEDPSVSVLPIPASFFAFDRKVTARVVRSEWPLILKEARLVPNIVDGRMRGYRIEKFPRRGILWETGLAPGDILLWVNRLELNEGAAPFSIYHMLKNQDEIFLGIERQKREITLHYVFR